MTSGVFPGSFNPLTIAHLAVADAAREQLGLANLVLALSQSALGKPADGVPTPESRADAIRSARGDRTWLDATVTDKRYLADIASGHDWLILGVDKWLQLTDDGWFESVDEWAASLRSVRGVAVAPRSDHPGPTPAEVTALHRRLGSDSLAVRVLVLDASYAHVSSTAVRSGRTTWLVAEFASSTVKEDLHEPEALAEDVGDRSPSNFRAGVPAAELGAGAADPQQ